MAWGNYKTTFFPGNQKLPVIVFVHGYCQSGEETWHETIRLLRGAGVKNQLLVIERTFDGNAGRVTLGEQLSELRVYIARLMVVNTIKGRVVWIGHSLGGMMADDLAVTFPQQTLGVINLGTAPTAGAWVLFNPKFWWSGAVLGLPEVIRAIVTGKSVRFPAAMVRGLFAGGDCEEERFQKFLAKQQPDSGWFFLQVLLSYFLPPKHLQHLRMLGEGGKRFLIGFKEDAIISPLALRRMAWRTNSPLCWVDSAHCWWLKPSASYELALKLKAALQLLQ